MVAIVRQPTFVGYSWSFWVENENRWVRLRVSSKGMRIIDKKGIDQVLSDLRARGEEI